jgi:pantoate--beta-alanine ligase
MKTLRTVAEVRRWLAPRRGTSRIGFVPTMGALHEGHVALLRAAKQACDLVVASVFVNPTQFNDPADLAAYPRQEAGDAESAAAAGVDTLFVPTVEDMYRRGHASTVEVQGPAIGFEGKCRPGHFNGVATVCLKLFCIVQPHVAFFGQKDAQQVAVVKQLIRDLNLDLEIQVVPTVRETDGLALSSRNARLSADDRQRALAIPRALEAGLAAYGRGGDPAPAARAKLTGLATDYVAVASFDGHPTLVIAASVGGTRLIDNVPLDRPELASLSTGVAAKGAHP